MRTKPENLVAVVIPVYQSELTPAEQLSLGQCLRVLSRYPIIIAKPHALDLSWLLGEYPQLAVKSFENLYFENIEGYNRLLTSGIFYEAFTNFRYVLIHQLDAFVFADGLEAWCNKNFDYVGAPYLKPNHWQNDQPRFYDNYDKNLRRILLNGGLSLRNIRACLRFLKVYQLFFGPWLGNEDMLFSLTATRLFWLRPWLRLPSYREAVSFAFEKEPQRCLALNNAQLPFGCHAWQRYDPLFWQPFIRQEI